jgi:hypothetical protein
MRYHSLFLTRKRDSVKMKHLPPGQSFPASQFSLEKWTKCMVKLILDFRLQISDLRKI